MAREWLTPGSGFVNEEGETEWLIPGGGIVNETSTFTALSSCIPISLALQSPTISTSSLISVQTLEIVLTPQASTPVPSITQEVSLQTIFLELQSAGLVVDCQMGVSTQTLSFAAFSVLDGVVTSIPAALFGLSITQHEVQCAVDCFQDSGHLSLSITQSLIALRYDSTVSASSTFSLSVVQNSVQVSADYAYVPGGFELDLVQPPIALQYDSNVPAGLLELHFSQPELAQAYVARIAEQVRLCGPINLAVECASKILRSLELYGPVNTTVSLQSIVQLVSVASQEHVPNVMAALSMSLSQLPVSTQISYPFPIDVSVSLETLSLELEARTAAVVSVVTEIVGALEALMTVEPAGATVDTTVTPETQQLMAQQRGYSVLSDSATDIFVDPIFLVMACNPAVVGVGDTVQLSAQAEVFTLHGISIAVSQSIAVAVQTANLSLAAASARSDFSASLAVQALTSRIWDATVSSSSVPRIDTSVGVARQTLTLAPQSIVGAAPLATEIYSNTYPSTGAQPDTFLVSIDGGSSVAVIPTALPDGSVRLVYSLAGTVAGLHTAIIVAQNAWGMSETSDPVQFFTA